MIRSVLAMVMALTLPDQAEAAAPLPDAARQIFADIAAEPGPGCAVGVMRGGELVAAEGFGHADLQTGRRIDPDTIFNVASVSKHFTAFAILQLAAAGRLSLDDSIRDFLPELPEYAQPVTVRHLLHHTGGLRDYISLAEMRGVPIADKLSEADALAIVVGQPRGEFTPGAEHAYSNTGYFVLAVIVERVTGQSMRDYAEQNIFAPLGMRSTSFVDSYPANLPALARGYSATDEGGYVVDESGWEMTGDGQVHTTVRDLALWEANLETGRVGGKALVEQMTEPGRLSDGEQLTYAKGLVVHSYRGLELIDHAGEWVGYTAHFARFPEQRIGVSVLCNGHFEPNRRAMRVADVYLGDRMSGEAGAAASPPDFAIRHAKVAADAVEPGVYANDIGAAFEIQKGESGVVLKTSDFASALLPAEGGVYAIRGNGWDDFISFPARNRAALGSDRHLFHKLTPWHPESIEGYVGAYRDSEAGVDISIERDADGLVTTLWGRTVKLRPVSANEFWLDPFGLMRFEGDTLQFRSPVVRGLVFKRIPN